MNMRDLILMGEAIMTSGQMLAAVSAIGTVLTTAIGLLWRRVIEQANSTEKKLAACEEHHSENQAKMLELASEVGELRGRVGVLSGMKGFHEEPPPGP